MVGGRVGKQFTALFEKSMTSRCFIVSIFVILSLKYVTNSVKLLFVKFNSTTHLQTLTRFGTTLKSRLLRSRLVSVLFLCSSLESAEQFCPISGSRFIFTSEKGMIEQLLAGSIAGISVDVALFPLDTIKTRLQSYKFNPASLYKTIYSGLSSTLLGSGPSAAAFFITYDRLKSMQESHMLAASVAEVAACSIRVPTDIVKQRMQSGKYKSLTHAFSSINNPSGFYQGFFITLFRDIPFAAIQFGIYESLKQKVKWIAGRDARPFEAAVCGCIAGSIAAALTTPLDVVKTRIMLERKV